jgi:hypothetical protein
VVFEKFIPPQKTKTPRVSIKRTGTIAFDATAVVAFGLAGVPGVALYFDPTRKLIGVKAMANLKEEGALRLTHRKRVSSVRARLFFESYGIPLLETYRLVATLERESGMIVLDLSDVKRRPGRRKKPV